jgi:cold shock CspA family protein
VTKGSVTKLVTSYGSRWGRIQPTGESREVFFNSACVARTTDFFSLQLGSVVEFEEQSDQVNGTRAVEVQLSPASEK